MSLGNEIHEWRKQLVEKLLLNGVKPEDLNGQVEAAESIVFGDQVVASDCTQKSIEESNALERYAYGHSLLKDLLGKADLSKDQLSCIDLFIFSHREGG